MAVTRNLEASGPVSVELDGAPAEVEAWQDAHVLDEARKSLLERRREVRLRTSRSGVPITLDAREALRLKEIRVLDGPEREQAASLARDVDAALGLFRSRAEPRAIYEKLGGLREASALVLGLDEALAERLALYRKERDGAVEPAARPAQARKEATDFTLEGLDGSKVSFRQATKGKVVLLTFWGYGCPPCRKEAPYLTKLQEAYGEKGFTVMAVNAWDEPRGVVEQFRKREGLKHPMLLQGSSVARDVYNVTSFPTSFWIDAEGYIVGKPEVGFSPQKYPSMVAKAESLVGTQAGE
jgi:thiol-disulfide isomerase/thioredoxin